MSKNDAKQSWVDYCSSKLSEITPLLQDRGYSLDEDQPHLGGERYLMQAVTTKSGKKLILLAKNTKGQRMVIKVTDDPDGVKELEHERTCRAMLKRIRFAYEVFFTPEEVDYFSKNNTTFSIQRFIAQESSFLKRNIEEQFDLSLKAFKAQESAHATTYRHRKIAGRTFGVRDSKDYLDAFTSFVEGIRSAHYEEKALYHRLEKALNRLEIGSVVIEQYCGFLTHTDFVPHNFRVKDGNIYLLDHSSIRFGNKYEGWARFLNFMALYNPELERLLTEYVHNNRTSEEHEALHLMRIYRLGEIIWYYIKTLDKSEGDLKKLNADRITFWSEVLAATLKKEFVSNEVRETYITTRDSLRSDEEKMRQIDLH